MMHFSIEISRSYHAFGGCFLITTTPTVNLWILKQPLTHCFFAAAALFAIFFNYRRIAAYKFLRIYVCATILQGPGIEP